MPSQQAWLERDHVVLLKEGGSETTLRGNTMIKVENNSEEQMSESDVNHYQIVI
jgi:hypothetical protein